MRLWKQCLGVTLVATAVSSNGMAAQEAGLSSIDFIVGCWAQPSETGDGLREFYLPPSENMLTGLSQFWRGGRIVDFEFHRIDGSPDGPVLTPHPRGSASVSFSPASITEDRVVWENLEHDFPQRIIYHRVATDTLVARIEGGEGAEARALEWRMATTACPSARG